jgi:cell division protease FtsH
MKRAEKILRQNMEVLHRISNALLDREILDADEIDKLIRGEELPPLEKQKNGQPTELPSTPAPAPKQDKTNGTPSVDTPPHASKAKKSA